MTKSEMSELADRLALILSINLVFPLDGPIEVSKIERRKGDINRKAIGYVYGFVDSALQCREEDITNLDVGLPILYHVIRKLFPGNEQAYVDFLMSHMEDEVTVLGMMAGGQEYREFLVEKRSPFGLSRLILEG